MYSTRRINLFRGFTSILLFHQYVCVYYSVQLNRSWEEIHQAKKKQKKTFNSEHLNFSGKELNVTDITEELFL